MSNVPDCILPSTDPELHSNVIIPPDEVDEFLANSHQTFTAKQLEFFREARRIYRKHKAKLL